MYYYGTYCIFYTISKVCFVYTFDANTFNHSQKFLIRLSAIFSNFTLITLFFLMIKKRILKYCKGLRNKINVANYIANNKGIFFRWFSKIYIWLKGDIICVEPFFDKAYNPKYYFYNSVYNLSHSFISKDLRNKKMNNSVFLHTTTLIKYTNSLHLYS